MVRTVRGVCTATHVPSAYGGLADPREPTIVSEYVRQKRAREPPACRTIAQYVAEKRARDLSQAVGRPTIAEYVRQKRA